MLVAGVGERVRLWAARDDGRSALLLPAVRHPYLTESVNKVACKSQSPPKSVDLSFINTSMKNRLTDFCGS